MTWHTEPLSVSPARAAQLQTIWQALAIGWWMSATVEERELWVKTFGKPPKGEEQPEEDASQQRADDDREDWANEQEEQ